MKNKKMEHFKKEFAATLENTEVLRNQAKQMQDMTNYGAEMRILINNTFDHMISNGWNETITMGELHQVEIRCCAQKIAIDIREITKS